MPNPKLERIILFVFSGLLIGLLMPPIEFVAVLIADFGFFRFRQIFTHDDYVMGEPWLSIVFVLVEIFSLYLLARFNKTLATTCLIIATASTVVLLEIMSHLPDISY